MKLPVSWLAEFVDISDLSERELADRITFAGIEIEGIEKVGADFTGICAALVETCEPHPDSDHLHVCTVFDGKERLQIVCGAPNCRAGLVTALAHVGAKVPESGDVLKKGKLRGVESFGMLCSARELSLSGDHSGIIELKSDVAPGTALSELFPEARPETVFEVEITWNRGDCLSILGIAREFSAILGRPLKLPPVDFPELPGAKGSDSCTVKVENGDECPLYTARVLPHVERLPSPEFMRRRLELCGMRSIDVVVDVANYVMLECGQPLHTFDYRHVRDGGIVVRNARPGETIRTLDGQDRVLDETMLLIADSEGPLAVAGVMGGEGSEIEPDTTSVLLESAAFSAPGIKRTETALSLHTEAAHRYERGVDPFLPDWASRRACHLLCKYANATVATGSVEDDHRSHEPVRVRLRFARANAVIGMPIAPERQLSILESLGFAIDERDADGALLRVPTWRLDCTHECDLVEEIARMNGLDALPDVVPSATVVPGADDAPVRAAAYARRVLAGLGFTETMNYSFTAPAVLDAFSAPGTESRRVCIPNPVSADHSVLRDSLIPQVFGNLAFNQAHGTATAAIFEAGRVFFAGRDGTPAEEDRVCAAVMGFAGRDGTDRMRKVDPRETLGWLKGALEALCEALHAPALRLEAADAPGFEPGLSATVFLAGRPVGVFGLVSAATCRKHRIASPVAVFEVRRDALVAQAFRVAKAKDVPSLPGVERDIALVAPEGVTHETIVKTIRKAGPKELCDVTLFDVFRGKQLGEGRTSLAYRLTYRAADRTLTSEEANGFHEAVKNVLRNKLGVEIRDA